jgi:hypothetical protein
VRMGLGSPPEATCRLPGRTLQAVQTRLESDPGEAIAPPACSRPARIAPGAKARDSGRLAHVAVAAGLCLWPAAPPHQGG